MTVFHLEKLPEGIVIAGLLRGAPVRIVGAPDKTKVTTTGRTVRIDIQDYPAPGDPFFVNVQFTSRKAARAKYAALKKPHHA